MITTTSSTQTDGIRPPLADPARPGQLVQRIRAEFIEMPGLMVTLPQAARLWNLTVPQAKAALTVLIDGGFLMCDPHYEYRRRGSCPRCS